MDQVPCLKFFCNFFVYFNSSSSNLLQIFLGWIRIRIEKNSWIRIRKKWMRIHSPELHNEHKD